MKKVLSIVLALAMVLCMIPALSADIKEDKSNKSYLISIAAADLDDAGAFKWGAQKANTSKANSLTFEYTSPAKVHTGYFEADAMMAVVTVKGFSFTNKPTSIVINGKKLDVDKYADYYSSCGAFTATGEESWINFPVELTDTGYSASYSIVVTSEETVKVADKDEKLILTETAEISLKLVNKDPVLKTQKIANIVDIKAGTGADAYIVGSKIYVDFENKKAPVEIKITYADENKAPFTNIVWAKKTGVAGFELKSGVDTRLAKSVATYTFTPDSYTANTAIYDKLKDGVGDEVLVAEDGKYYLDKDYAIIVREDIHEADPKGIYLEKAEATIAVGEEYTPVVKAISNGAVVKPTKVEITSGDYYLNNVTDAKVIGVKPGVAFIKATYAKTYADKPFSYITSTQKITVTLPGASIPPQTVDYVVTCRNLNVRKGPSTSYGKNGMIHRGDVVKVVEIANGWAKLDNGTYVCAKYIAK